MFVHSSTFKHPGNCFVASAKLIPSVHFFSCSGSFTPRKTCQTCRVLYFICVLLCRSSLIFLKLFDCISSKYQHQVAEVKSNRIPSTSQFCLSLCLAAFLSTLRYWGNELQQHLNHEIFTNHPPSTATKIIWLWWFYAYGVSASCVISKEKSFFFCRMGDLYILNTRCQLTTTIKEAFEGAGYKVRAA